jgi:hypothetical protein
MFSLEEALGKVKILWEKDRRAGSRRDSALEHLGYKSVKSGTALRTIATLKKYGLTEERDGRIYLSNLALDLVIYPPDDERYQKALREAALRPSIYNKLYEQYRDGLPSDTTLRSELTRVDEFHPLHVDGFIRDFRSTIAFAGLEAMPAGRQIIDQPSQHASRITAARGDAVGHSFVAGMGEAVSKSNPFQPKADMNTEIFTLTEGDVSLQWPAKMSPESYEDFKDWLDLIVRKAKRATEKKDPVENPPSDQ